MLSRKIFENLDTAMAILVLFEQFLCKLCWSFLPLIPSALPNMMHLFLYFRLCVLKAQELLL